MGAGSVRRSSYAAAAPPVPSAVCERHLMSRLFPPHELDSAPDHRARLGASVFRRHLLLLLLLVDYIWMREAAEARPVLAWRELQAGTCGAKACMRPAGDGDRSASIRPDSESAACACAEAVRPGASGPAPLAVSRARVPGSLDGLRCWCQVACVPACDHALSEYEAEASPSQPTAELVDGMR